MITKIFNDTVSRATLISRELSHDLTTLEHLAIAFLEDEDVAPILKKCSFSFNKFEKEVIAFLDSVFILVDNPDEDNAGITVLMQQIIQRARTFSSNGEPLDINSLDVLKSLLSEEDCYAAYFFRKYGVTKERILKKTAHGLFSGKQSENNSSQNTQNQSASVATVVSTSNTSAATSPLDAYCIDYVKKAEAGHFPPLIGRADEIFRLQQVLLRHTKYNPLLVGEPGVGKTAIIEGLSLKILEGDVPLFFKDAKIYGLNITNILAGARYRGDFEERIKQVIEALLAAKTKVFLFIDEIHTIMGMGATDNSGIDAANLLKPMLSNPSGIRCIGATTYKEVSKLEKDKALLRRFQKIDVKEPSRDEAILIVEGVKNRYEAHHKAKYQKKHKQTTTKTDKQQKTQTNNT
jgi:ATP-dependent Clp protease ATP-binding subunit ClpA